MIVEVETIIWLTNEYVVYTMYSLEVINNMALKKIAINIPEDVLERLDLYANRMGLNRTSAMIYLITSGMDNSGVVSRGGADEE